MNPISQTSLVATADTISRRELLRVGGIGFAGLSLSQWLAAAALNTGTTGARADSCIVIFLNGGPSHLDMWDMKPQAPVEVRGEFKPISSTLPGVQLSEYLPRLSQLMHRVTLVRSMNHSVNNSHAAAVYSALTGHDRGEQGGGAKPTDQPPLGAVLSLLRPSRQNALPYVTLPYKTQEGAGGPLQPGFLAGFIGRAYDPFWVVNDPNSPQFHVPNLTLASEVLRHQLRDRGRLLGQLQGRSLDATGNDLSAMNQFQQRAFDLLTSNTAQKAFEIDREPAAARDSYGRNVYGQSVLLARRLIEAGTRLVTLSWAPDANATWDTHGGNFTKLRNKLLPQFDAACSSLIVDLIDRGMFDRTLVAVLGDFGRTPRVNAAAGRDHWNGCYTIMLAGGGVKQGYIFGASDRIGSLPAENPVTPGDVISTMYSLFGIDAAQMIHDSLNRPLSIVPKGRVLRELVA